MYSSEALLGELEELWQLPSSHPRGYAGDALEQVWGGNVKAMARAVGVSDRQVQRWTTTRGRETRELSNRGKDHNLDRVRRLVSIDKLRSGGIASVVFSGDLRISDIVESREAVPSAMTVGFERGELDVAVGLAVAGEHQEASQRIDDLFFDDEHYRLPIASWAYDEPYQGVTALVLRLR